MMIRDKILTLILSILFLSFAIVQAFDFNEFVTGILDFFKGLFGSKKASFAISTHITTRPPTTTAPPTTTTSQQCLPIGLLVTPSTVSIGNQLTIQAVSYYPYVWVRIRNAENNNEEIPGTVCNNCFECTDCSSPAPYVWTWRPIATSQGSYQIYFIGSLVDPPNPNSWFPSNVVSYSIVTTPGTTALTHHPNTASSNNHLDNHTTHHPNYNYDLNHNKNHNNNSN
ncbi:MAG: hypothetical protein NZ893_02245 [Candidatus Aenigmarchaeota archaeon]|nr:hypothetical protein [Candidatus Aenigmarchaeota archaeon]